MIKYIIYLVFLISSISIAQIPPNYYDTAIGKKGDIMKQALHNIIDNHTVISYSQIWTSCQTTDKKSNGKVWDMYSDIPGGTPPYEYTFVSDQCGNYSGEGSCYNREHSFPKSWFNNANPMSTDIFHIYPTDGYVNGRRSNYPFGEVGNATWTSQNGSKLGPNTTSGYSGTVFEPIDEYKGDFARTYFYMATRYYGEDGSWSGSPMVNGAEPKPWALSLLYQWHLQDTVSTKEIDRNNAVYGIQNNRNPFIDHPQWVDSVWFPSSSINYFQELAVSFYPNPANTKINITIDKDFSDINVQIIDISGRILLSKTMVNSNIQIDISSLESGIYILNIRNQQNQFKILKMIKQ
ncbi:MAG: endonuclease [Bacteroidales bacterium]|nr:endonuclease [Bacteroidales bacterium]